MTVSAILIIAIFFISLVLTMVGLGGGLIFSPLFVILGFAKSVAAIGGLGMEILVALILMPCIYVIAAGKKS